MIESTGSLFSLLPDPPPGFTRIESKTLAVCNEKAPFALVTDNAHATYQQLTEYGHACKGIIISFGEEYEQTQLGDAVFHITVPKAMRTTLASFATAQLSLVRALHTSSKEKTEQEQRKIAASFPSFSEPDEEISSFEWTLQTVITFIENAVEEFERVDISEFPETVIRFFSDHYPEYGFIGLYTYNENEQAWRLLASRNIVQFTLPHDFPVSNVKQNRKEGDMRYGTFSLGAEHYLLAVKEGSDVPNTHERAIYALFITLVASFYRLKKISSEAERKIIEISNVRDFTSIIKPLKHGRLTLEDAIYKLQVLLQLDGIVLAEPALGDPEAGFNIVTAAGVEVTSWNELISDVINSGTAEAEGWELYYLFDNQRMDNLGAIACKLTQNPTLQSIQAQQMEFLRDQIVTVLSERKYHEDSITDALTGVFNRRHSMEQLQDRFNQFRGDATKHVTVGMLDIDHFKRVNDTYGHKAGDEILKAVARTVGKSLRKHDFVGRYGGEEFVVLLEAPLEAARSIAERMRASVADLETVVEGMPVRVTISVGLAPFNRGESADRAISKADEHLYAAKEGGRNRVVSE